MKIEYDLENFYVYHKGRLVSTIPLTPEQKAQLKAEVDAIQKENMDLMLYGSKDDENKK